MNKKTIIEMINNGKTLPEIAALMAQFIHDLHRIRQVSSDAGAAAIWRDTAGSWRAAGLLEDFFWALVPDVLAVDKDRFAKIKALATGPVSGTQGKRGAEHHG